MPKKSLNINPFHGGLSEHSDARDIQHHELAAVENQQDALNLLDEVEIPQFENALAENKQPQVSNDLSSAAATLIFSLASSWPSSSRATAITESLEPILLETVAERRIILMARSDPSVQRRCP